MDITPKPGNSNFRAALTRAVPRAGVAAAASHRVVTDDGDACGWALVLDTDGGRVERTGVVLGADIGAVEEAIAELQVLLGDEVGLLLEDADKDRSTLEPARRPVLKGLGWHRASAGRVTRKGVSRTERGERARALAALSASSYSKEHPLSVACDASLPSKGTKVATGWVSRDGRMGSWSGSVKGAPRTTGWAELLGVVEVVLAHKDPAQHLLVLTDSQEAVRAAADLRAGSISVLGASVVTTLPLAEVLGGQTRVRVEWVKGHAGFDLNEAAHRMALASGREATREQHAGALAAVRRNLVLEMAS